MKTNDIKISVVVPLYNKEMSIEAALQSVLAQTYTDYELIVVDDGSTDNSLNVVREYTSSLPPFQGRAGVRPLIRVIHKENGGVSSARNRGIEESKGEYIAFLDADDLWDKEYLAEQVKLIYDFPDAVMFGINFAETNNGQLVRKLATGLPEGYRGYVDNYFQIDGRHSDLFCSSSVVIRKDVFDKVGLFDERIKYAEDTDMWWRIIATHKAAFYDKYMVFYRYDAENRAMKRTRPLKYFAPYYVDKYHEPSYQANPVFYRFVNTRAAQLIRPFFFSNIDTQRTDAQVAVRKIDYSVVPFKYRLLYKCPYWMARILDKLDKLYHK